MLAMAKEILRNKILQSGELIKLVGIYKVHLVFD